MTTIGILLDHRTYRRLQSGRTGNERVKLYNKAARRLGLKLMYMSLAGIHLQSGKATGFSRKDHHYAKTTRLIPKVIHNRTFPQGGIERRRLRSLSHRSYVFNSQNRYPKYRIHRLLQRDPWLRQHLPPSQAYSRQSLRRMMEIYDTIYIKPQRGSVGRGIMRIRRVKGGLWSIRTLRGSKILNKKAIYRKVQQNVGDQLYMIQKGIDLATYQGRPYDIRVSVQRGQRGKWQITGMVGKVARRGSHVTNVAKGGTVKRCELLFRHSRLPVHATRAKVAGVSLQFANYIGRRLYRLADIGLDIGLSRDGKPYFIEMNCRDQRYSFAKAGLSVAFYRTYETPLRYAAYLARR
ncbi:MAG: YheC/YheD family protein [Paenibacillaceae bacterium]